MNKKCYTPVKGIDDVIAKKVVGWTPQIVANLRALYDEREEKTNKIADFYEDSETTKTQNKIPNTVLKNSDGSPRIFYRGFATKEDKKIHSILETLPGKEDIPASDYIGSGVHLSESDEEAMDYAKIKTDNSEEQYVDSDGTIKTVKGRRYRGDFAQVEAFFIDSKDAIILEFDSIKEYRKNPDAEKADIVILKKSTLGSENSEIVVRDASRVLLRKETESKKETIEEAPRPSETMSIEELTIALTTMRKMAREEDFKQIQQKITSPEYYIEQLVSDFPIKERINRINMIATMFSDVIDSLEYDYPDRTRKEIIQGFTDTETNQEVGGLAFILNEIYAMLQDNYTKALSENNEELYSKYEKIFNNWAALVSFAKIKLRNTEDINLGQSISYTIDTNSNNFDENKLIEKYIMEEAKKESWMEEYDQESSFGSLSKEVRKIISRIPALEGTEVKYDDLGFPIMKDPISTHQELLEVLKGIDGEEDMMKVLYEYAKKNPWIDLLLEDFNPTIKTAFYVNFKKNFQVYSKLLGAFTGTISKYKTLILNKTDLDRVYSNFLTSVKNNNILNTNQAIFEEDGTSNKIIPERVKELQNYILDHLDKDPNNPLATPKYWTISKDEKEIFLNTVLTALNIPNNLFVKKVLNNPQDSKSLINNIRDIGKHGLSIGNNTSLSYAQLLSRPTKTSKKGILREKISNILGIEFKYNNKNKIESRARYMGNTYFSNVIPSFLGDMMDSIAKKISKNNNSLKKFIEDTYFSSSMFYSKQTGEIRNKWLKELYESDLSKEGSFAENFIYKKFLGTDELEFENFTEKQHAIHLIQEFLSGRQIRSKNKNIIYISEKDFHNQKEVLDKSKIYYINNTNDAYTFKRMNAGKAIYEKSIKNDFTWYPIFILGDSGVAKFIQARRYGKEEILNGLFDTFMQEEIRMLQTKAMNNKLISGNHELIANFSKNDNTYITLPFLNEDFVAYDGTKGKYSSLINRDNLEDTVKQAISEYMKDSVDNFKKRMDSLGVLDINKEQELVHFSQDVSMKKEADGYSLDNMLEDYYWNTKFATIQQLQMMTIDPSFYKGTKDLQKRYKEIHAPGNILSVEAIDPYTNTLYSQDGIERVIYFKDIEVNAENTDPKFMKSVAYNFGLNTSEYKAMAPSLNATERKNLAIELGKNTSVYKAYTKNTLTDGQGYRSLTSYRKVMGMAAQWTPKMETAYRQILDIRRRNQEGEAISAEDISELAKLAVVFQPIKPYLYGFENFAINSNEVVPIPVQHKYAEIILIPELLPEGSKLRDIANYMEDPNNNVDLICSTMCVKVGNFGAADLDYMSEYFGTNLETGEKVHASLIDKKDYPKYSFSSEYIDKNGNATSNDIEKIKVDSSNINNQLAKGYIHQLSYKDYRIQTNVPEHINSSQLFGTQVRKLIMAGINKTGDYRHYLSLNKSTTVDKVNLGGNVGYVNLGGEKSNGGNNLIRFYNSLISANIVDSYNTFQKSIKDKSTISKILKQATANNLGELQDNMIAFSLDENGEFINPLFEGSLAHNSSALLFSMFKKSVNKQAIKGGSAVQASAMGLTANETTDALKEVVDVENPNNVLYSEVEIPFDLSYTYNGQEVALDYNTYVNPDGTLKLGSIISKDSPEYKWNVSYKDEDGNVRKPLIEEDYPDILSFISYRIPTEREYSMMVCKVARFSNKMSGGVIKSPAIGTVKSGFDFDIDKLYFMRREYKAKNFSKEEKAEIKKHIIREEGDLRSENEIFNEYILKNKLVSFQEYDFDKAPLENSRTSRNNMLIQLIQARLSDPETYINRYTPGGFSNASKAARLMRELVFGKIAISGDKTVSLEDIKKRVENSKTDPEPNYDSSDPLTILIYNQQNNIAGKLIGIFANQNIHHALVSAMNKFQLKRGIQFAGSRELKDLLYNPDIDASANVAEFLSASVDAVKDPVLNYLNLNTVTADAGALLARLGFTTEQIGLLFNQPIIKEICDYKFNYSSSDVDSAITAVMEKYNISNEVSINSSIDYSKDRLAYNIAVANNKEHESILSNNEFIINQYKIGLLFKEIMASTSEVSQFVRNTKFTAANAVGSTFGDMYSQQMKVNKYIKSFSRKSNLLLEVSDYVSIPINTDPIKGSDQDYLDSLVNNPFGYEQAMYDMNRKALKELNKYFPYNKTTFSAPRNYIANLTKSGILNAETINSIHSDILVFILNQQENSIFNGIRRWKDTELTTREYFTKHFAEDLYNKLKKDPGLRQLSIFEYMQFPTNTDTNTTSIMLQDVGGLNPDQKNMIQESWAELNSIPKYRELSEHLFLYNFYKLGFDFSPLSFIHLAPSILKNNMIITEDYNGNAVTYTQLLNNINNTDDFQSLMNNGAVRDFTKQYILNHLDNYSLVYNVSGNVLPIIKKRAFDNGVAKESFTLDHNVLGDKIKPLILSTEDGTTSFKAAIIIDGLVYIADNSSYLFNSSEDGVIKYTYIDTTDQNINNLNYSSINPDDRFTKEIITQEGSTALNEEDVEIDTFKYQILDTLSTDVLASAVFNAIMKTGEQIDPALLTEALNKTSRESLIQAIIEENIEVIDPKSGKPLCF